jgi:hypothetical protein
MFRQTFLHPLIDDLNDVMSTNWIKFDEVIAPAHNSASDVGGARGRRLMIGIIFTSCNK